jgi:O-antigen/teichoic acid export membrane protein
VIGVVVTFLVDLAVVSRLVPLRPVIDVPYWRNLVRGSIVIGLAIGLGQIFFRIDGVILALVRPAEEVGFYGAAYKFLELADLIVAAIALSVFPTLTHYFATANPGFRPLVQRTFDVLLAVATAVSLLFLLFPEELVLLTSGSEFEAGADALRILAPYPMLFFVNALIWRVMIAAGHDRALLAIAASVLTLNVALNVALLPPYGFRAAAVTVIVSEVFSIALSAFVLRRREGFLPSLRYGAAIAASALVMAAVALLLPVHWVIAASAGVVAYAGVLLVLPGSIRDGLRQIRHELRSDK